MAFYRDFPSKFFNCASRGLRELRELSFASRDWTRAQQRHHISAAEFVRRRTKVSMAMSEKIISKRQLVPIDFIDTLCSWSFTTFPSFQHSSTYDSAKSIAVSPALGGWLGQFVAPNGSPLFDLVGREYKGHMTYGYLACSFYRSLPTPVTMVISTINHSYWSYVHQLSYHKSAIDPTKSLFFLVK